MCLFNFLPSAISFAKTRCIALWRSSNSFFWDKCSKYPCGLFKGSNIIWWFSIKKTCYACKSCESTLREKSKSSYSVRIQENTGQYLDTFHAVFTLYAHDNSTFPFTRNARINIQKKFIFKTNSKIKYVVENINKTKMKMLTERDLLLLIILRRRKREKKPWVRVRQVYLESNYNSSLTKMIHWTLHCNFLLLLGFFWWIDVSMKCYRSVVHFHKVYLDSFLLY